MTQCSWANTCNEQNQYCDRHSSSMAEWIVGGLTMWQHLGNMGWTLSDKCQDPSEIVDRQLLANCLDFIISGWLSILMASNSSKRDSAYIKPNINTGSITGSCHQTSWSISSFTQSSEKLILECEAILAAGDHDGHQQHSIQLLVLTFQGNKGL